MLRTHTFVDSPVGPLTIVGADGGLCGLYMDAQRHRPPDDRFGARDDTLLGEVADQLRDYFDGRRREFTLDLAPVGTDFQRQVWTALAQVPYATTVSYGWLAARIGRPTAARAVGAAVGRNPIGIVVPCHRVVGTAGGLTGYAGGLERKQYLLALEAQARCARHST